MNFDGKTKSSHLLKLENALFALASVIQQRHLLYRKEVSITVEKENVCIISMGKKKYENG